MYTCFKGRIIIGNVSDSKILALIITKVRMTLVSSSVLTDMSKIALVDAPDRQRPWVLKLFLLAKLFFYGCTKLPWQFLPHEPSSQGKHGKTFSRLATSRKWPTAYTWRWLGIHLRGVFMVSCLRFESEVSRWICRSSYQNYSASLWTVRKLAMALW